jgi:ATP-dependent exoDNAse (exonuclease V) beta subunit
MREAIRNAKLHFDQIDDWTEHEAWLEEFLMHKNIRPFFVCGQADVRTEQEIVNKFGDTKRCDRVIVRDKDVQVVDFKSAKDSDGGYAAQVKEYKGILKSIYPQRTARGFLMYLDSCEVEEV